MARFRNPRFAPEFLEQRLSPSSVLATDFVAQVSIMDDPEPLPPPQPGDPTTLPPKTPAGPSLPG